MLGFSTRTVSNVLFWVTRKKWLILAFLLSLSLFYFPSPDGLSYAGHRTLIIVLVTLILIISESIPFPAVAILILIMQVILGIASADEVASSFMSDAVFFIMGSLMLAVAIVSQGLDNIMKVRNKAISDFSKYNIRSYETYSKLEDVFVPLYFLHRYQTESTIKLIGGLDYNYAKRDDNQTIVENIPYDIQNNALISILKTLEAKNLAIPKSKLKLFPPRAYNSPRTRESFKSMTGVSFDPLSAVSSASEMTLSLLLNVERMNRLVIQSSLNNDRLKNMTLDYLLSTLTNNTFKSKYELNLKFSDRYLFEVQQVINNNYLKFLLNLASNKSSFFQVKAIAKKELSSIMDLLVSKKYMNKYKHEYLSIIKNFKIKPELFELIDSPKIPDGSPIGSSNLNELCY